MARILLGKPRFLTPDQRGLVPPMGLLYLASVLRQAGHEVRLYDAVTDLDRAHPRFRQLVRTFAPDVVGLGAITFEAGTMEALARAAREEAPSTRIVVGGPHPTSYPLRCARAPGVDAVVVGEGEETLPELVAAWAAGRDGRDVAGTAWVDDAGGLVLGPPRAPIRDLDALPFPAWDLLDLDLYRRHASMANVGWRRYLPIVTSRGCPWRCIYCHQVHGKTFRARSAASVLAEIGEASRRFGIDDFEVVDDVFNLDRKRAMAILDGVASRGRPTALHFPNGVRTDLLDAEQIDLMARAGTQYLAVAVETASPRLQAYIHKNLDLDKVRANAARLVQSGIYVCGFFMLGFPTETLAEARATVDFAVGSPLHQAQFFVVTPFEGTPMFDLCADVLTERGQVVRPEDLDYFKGRCNVSAMTDGELFGLQRAAYRRFYASPVRAWRIFRDHPRRGHLFFYGLLALRKMLPRPRGNVAD